MKIVHTSHSIRVLWIAIFYGINSLLYGGQILRELAPTVDGTHRQGIFENRDLQGQLIAEAGKRKGRVSSLERCFERKLKWFL